MRRARSRAGPAAPSLPHGPGRAGQVSVSKGRGLLCVCCHYDSPVKARSLLAPAAPHAGRKAGRRPGLRLEPSRRSHGPSTAMAPCPDPRDFPLLMISRRDRGVPSTRGAALVRFSPWSVPGVHPTPGHPQDAELRAQPKQGRAPPAPHPPPMGTASDLGPPGSSGVG